jgi:catechol 2,3-dioxygenase-like lactoylglutathione lyase family enzyme
MRATRLNHLTVNVDGDDDRRAYEFYCGLLGMPDLNHLRPTAFKEAIPGDWFGIEDIRLHVFDYPAGGQWRAPGSPQPGGPHFAIYVDDLEGAIAEFERRGIAFWSNGEGIDRQVWILDPGGNTVELSQDPLFAK